MSWNPTPVFGGARWNGNATVATTRQLISSVDGLYQDIQDINLSSVTATTLNVSTLTAQQWISTPELYVSSIIGGGIQVNNGLLQISTGDISFLSLSTLSFKGIDLGGIDFSFDLGLGNALGGFLGGLGGIVGGAFIGLGTGVGLGIQSLTNGLFSLANTQGGTPINNTVFETINGTTQIQISTIGNDYPLYSSIFRSVSSLSPNSVPGQEIFLSTFFTPGTTCVRSVSDPLPLLTTDSNINTSTIQSFGQWVPFVDPTVAGEDIIARDATFSSIVVYPPIGGIPFNSQTSNSAPNDAMIYSEVNMFPQTYNYNVASNNNTIANSGTQYNALSMIMYLNATLDFISTPYTQYTSTIGNYLGGVYFIESTITSTLTTIPKFTYTGNLFGGANFAVCEVDESGFLSTGTMDLIAQSSNITFQWGLAVDNRNSTIAQGTAKRVSWDNPANTSNFIDIPVPQSTITSNYATSFETKLKALEVEHQVNANDVGLGGFGGMAFQVSRATFGAGTTFQNVDGYPYQFNNNLYVNGTIEADQIIALSSFTSTNVVTYFSTFLLEADEAYIEYAQVSTLYSTDLIGANSISTFGIENYSHLSQFSFVSTLVVDLQILEGTNGNTTCYLNNITSNIPGSRIAMGRGTFQHLSTLNTSTGNLIANVANIPTFNTSNLTSSNAFIPNFYGDNLYGEFATLSTVTTSTLNVNTISTTSHSGSDITCDNITINDFATFPSVGNGSNVISMTFSNNTNSNTFTPLLATIIQGSVFPQTSNQFSIETTGSNTVFTDREGFIFDLVNGNTFTFGAGIETVQVNDGDLLMRSARYGTQTGGYLQPRAFAQQYQQGLGTSDQLTTYTQVTDSNSNTFLVSDYNFMPCMMGFNMLNTAVAVNEVIIRPYNSNGYWWVRLDVYLNAGAAGNDMIWYWNNLLFPYNMMT